MRILYLDLDTLRPDHMGCYGYHRNTTPELDRIAAEALLFRNFYTSDAPCFPARSAMMSGRFGIHTGAINHGGSTGDFRLEGRERRMRSNLSSSSFPAMLKKSGLYPVYIGSFAERHSAYSFYAGFREVFDTGMGGQEKADVINAFALKWLEDNRGKDDWFLHLHYWDPHTPYRSPPEFGNPFAAEPMIALYSEEFIAQQRKLGGPHTIQDINMYDNARPENYPRQLGEVRNMQEMQELIDAYDCGIRYMDQKIGDIVAQCKAQGIWDDLVVIISADHGENFGELGLYAEHASADLATCHIPLIMRWPGKISEGEHSGFWYNVDLVPTFAELLGLDPEAIWDGQSFARVRNDGKASGRAELILSQNAHVCQRSVRWQDEQGDWLYMRTYHDGWHPHFRNEMLFELGSDPYEQNDVAQQFPLQCREAAYRLMCWHDQMMLSQPTGYYSDPMWQTLSEGGPFHARSGKMNEYLQRLEQTGRSEAAALLRQKHVSLLNL